MEATIYKSTGSFYLAKGEDRQFWTCRIRGRLKAAGNITSTNPVAVGDKVLLDIEHRDDRTALIREILPRDNYIIRSSPHSRYHKHIVAANMHQAILIATLKSPRTSAGFIDRFLVTAEAYHIPAQVIFNKADIYSEALLEAAESRRQILAAAGYKTGILSAVTGEGVDGLSDALRDKTSLLIGHSGAGKTTLINKLLPDLGLKVGEVSAWSDKGKHTTTFAEMFDLPLGGSIIDTPGVKEFGLVDIDREELAHYLPEMRERMNGCRFNNCIHVNEPGCAVKAAVAAGEIDRSRYESYLSMLDTLGA